MSGRHTGGGQRRFAKELVTFGLKVLFWGAIAIGALWLFQKVPSLGAGEESASTSTLQSSQAVAPDSTVAPTTTTEQALPPSEVTVLVLNSTNASGLAGRLTDEIAGLGYDTLEADNYATPLADSVLWYAAGYDDEAEELARVLPDMDIQPNPEAPLANLVVVLGASYTE